MTKSKPSPVDGDRGKKRKAVEVSARARKKPKKLSEDIVVESDSDEPRPGSSNGHGLDSESEPEKQLKTKKPRLERVKETKPLDPPVPDNTSREGESEHDENSISSHESVLDDNKLMKTKIAPVKVHGVGNKIQNDPLEQISDESDQEEDSYRSSPVPLVRDAAVATETSNRTPVHITKSTPRRPFEPPMGYSRLNLSSSSSAISFPEVAGKHLWHITAPSNISISAIKELTLDSIRSGAPVFTQNGVEYAFIESSLSENGHSTILLPSNADYNLATERVEKTLHLQQKIVLPNLTRRQADPVTGSNAAAEVNQPSVLSIRLQPKGLRMRYRPPGFGSGSPGKIGSSSDSTDDEEHMLDAPETIVFKMPKAPRVPKDHAQDRTDTDIANNISQFPEKTLRKKRKMKKAEKAGSEPQTPSIVDTTKLNGPMSKVNGVVPGFRTPSNADEERAIPNTPLTNGDTPHEIYNEAKTRREEERKKKREVKEEKRKSKLGGEED